MEFEEYVKSLSEAVMLPGAHATYFPPDKADRKAANLKLVRDFGFGLGGYPEAEVRRELGGVYGRLIVKPSLDATGVCLDAREFIAETLAAAQPEWCRREYREDHMRLVTCRHCEQSAAEPIFHDHTGAVCSHCHGKGYLILEPEYRPYTPGFPEVGVPLELCPATVETFMARAEDGVQFTLYRVSPHDHGKAVVWFYPAESDFAERTCRVMVAEGF